MSAPSMIIASVPTVTAPPPIPAAATGSIGFKDWAVICDALGTGRQSLIFRKGGIAEGRDGFCFKHDRFFLFPTQYHQQFEKVRPEEMIGVTTEGQSTDPDTVEIRYLFNLEFAAWVDDWQKLVRLEPMHVWKEDVVRERFDYEDQRGLQCAFGRVFRLERPWLFPYYPSYGGCRSWVTLAEPPADLGLVPVLPAGEHELRRRAIGEILHLE